MKTPALPTLLLLLLTGLSAPFAAACRAEPPAVQAPAGPAPLLPQSALAALVRVLEAVDAQRPPGALIQVRAVECDSMIEHARAAEFARVYLHTTVFAADVASARAAFDALHAALEEEASAGRRLEAVSAERIRRVFGGLDWAPPGAEELVSYSDAIRLEVAPGERELEPGATAGGGAPGESTAEHYVDGVAERHALPVHAVASRVSEPTRNVRDLRCLLRPSAPDAHQTLESIGSFLDDLESGSPAARLTHLVIERASVVDPLRDDSWTFEAELTVRVPAR